MMTHNPPHPGKVIRELCIEPLGLTVTAVAQGLDVSRKTLSTIINEKSNISPEMLYAYLSHSIHLQRVG